MTGTYTLLHAIDLLPVPLPPVACITIVTPAGCYTVVITILFLVTSLTNNLYCYLYCHMYL